MTPDYRQLPWLTVDDPRPSRRIYAELSRRIAQGSAQYAAGARLNIGLLADEFGVTRTTVGKALRLLEADGAIVMYQGLGWYVTEPPPAGDGGS